MAADSYEHQGASSFPRTGRAPSARRSAYAVRRRIPGRFDVVNDEANHAGRDVDGHRPTKPAGARNSREIVESWRLTISPGRVHDRTTGTMMREGRAASCAICWWAGRESVPLSRGSPVLRLRSQRGKLLEVTWTRRRWPARKT